MFDFLEWYIPWSQLDLPLKLMAVSWIATTLLAVIIYIYAVLLKKPWLSMQHMQQPPEADKSFNSAQQK